VSLIERAIREKIVLVGVALGNQLSDDVDASLDELSQLVDTAGADEVARVVQRRDAPDPTYYVGKGKAEELKDISLEVDSDTVVFDDELTPAQQYNLEKLLGRTAIDRTAVILDIFAQNASSQEGKAQVELALLRYRLPRLRGRGKALSQQAGGMSAAGGARIGSRGPGETQLEVDRRRIQRRIAKLERDLLDIARHRDTQRKGRARSRLQHVAIVGYTNAGKSTLLNRLTDAGVLVEDRLFATLDATTRRLDLPGGERVLCTDTVGFIRKLPHGLVEAFKSTLEVVNEADLLVHVVDASSHDPGDQMLAVREVLAEIDADAIPELIVFNKTDRAARSAERLVERHPGSVAISALTGDGVDVLLRTIGDRLRALADVVELLVPYERGDLLAAVHREGEVVSESHEEGGIRVRARLDAASRGQFRELEIGS
jgi:GTP-binding protein HflX